LDIKITFRKKCFSPPFSTSSRFQKPSLLPRPLSNALERPKTLPPPVPAPKPAPPENLNPAADVEHIESPEKLSLKAR
jgi:hypothetical protein